MRRAGNLIAQVADYDNIALAFTRAARGKWNRPDVQAFLRTSDYEIRLLRDHLLRGALPPGNYRFFEIKDPKPRVISVAPFRHRVLHHALMNVCGPYFDRAAYFHSYACRKGKGSLAALQFLRSQMSANGWYLKMDVRKYFDSVDHAILLDHCNRLFKDRQVLALIASILGSYEVSPGKGLPIGNLSSQYFANHYLSPLDRYIKENIRARYLVRYMDDLLIWNSTRETLKESRQRIEEYAQEKLGLSFKLSQVNRQNVGIPFLGYRVFREGMRLNPNSRRRLWARWKKYDELMGNSLITQAKYAAGMRALLSFAEHADVRGLKKKYLLVNGFVSE